MKKLLLLSVMVLAGLSASAQFKSQPSVNQQTNSKTKMANMPQSQRSFQAVAPKQDLKMRRYAPVGGKLTLDPTKVKPVTRSERTFAKMSAAQNKVVANKAQNHKMVNLQPTMTVNPQASSQAKAARKTPAFAEQYTGIGYDYSEKEDVEWTMTPTTAEVGEDVLPVFVGIIPLPDYLSGRYPDGIPAVYSIDEEGVITIEPQAIANYENEETGTTHYLTICSATSDDGTMTLKLDENGKLTFTVGNWIMLAEFDGVEFDYDEDAEEFGEAYVGYWELFTDVNFYFNIETRIDYEYNAHGMDYFEGEAVSWTMQRGTRVTDDEETHFFVNMTPMLDIFSEIYPNGIDVEYTQVGNTITVKPQVIASIPADEESEAEYIMLCSGTSEDGSIVLTEGENGPGTLKLGDDESIIIGAWSTDKFDSSYDTYLGSYSYIENISYRLPGEPAVAPKNVSFEPNELVLFAGLGYSGYGYNDNLAMMGAFAPTTFRNTTTDLATGFDWSVLETDREGEESTITGNKKNFTLYTQGDCTYEDFKLIAYNEEEASEPFTWGVGHCPNNEGTAPRYEAIHVYAGQGASAFGFTDGSYAVMTRQNPDGDLTFYTNWGTPDIYERASISTIYSYQGKPSTPLFITGVTLPLVSFEANDDFNLHIKLCKCTRDSKGKLTVGDVIAEGDATLENVNDDYDAGITAVEFTELYVEDEFGMSETKDYLFIEDEFVVIIEGWDNGTFSGVLGSQDIDVSNLPSTWFTETGEEEGTRHYYTSWFPQLFIGLLDATYGYLYTEDETDLLFAKEGGQSSIHVDPMYYTTDEETEEPTYSLYTESIFEDGEEVDEMPDWVSFEVANEDYTTAIGIDGDGDEYEYFVNGIDYDLVINVEPLPEGVENRYVKVVFFQTGAKLTVTITQDIDPDGISTIVEKTPIKNSRAFNLAGQPIGNNYKGVVVKDGKKVVVK